MKKTTSTILLIIGISVILFTLIGPFITPPTPIQANPLTVSMWILGGLMILTGTISKFTK
jgi:hypothetical protein